MAEHQWTSDGRTLTSHQHPRSEPPVAERAQGCRVHGAGWVAEAGSTQQTGRSNWGVPRWPFWGTLSRPWQEAPFKDRKTPLKHVPVQAACPDAFPGVGSRVRHQEPAGSPVLLGSPHHDCVHSHCLPVGGYSTVSLLCHGHVAAFWTVEDSACAARQADHSLAYAVHPDDQTLGDAWQGRYQ